MAVLSDYTSGRISLANGSTTVTGTGTLFNVAKFREGDTLQIQNLTAVIASVNSDTSLTLTAPWTGTTLTNAVYRARYLPDGARVTAQATTLIELLGNGVLTNIAELGVEEGKAPVGGPSGQYELKPVPTDPNGSLSKLAALTAAADKGVMFSGPNGAATFDLTAAARELLNDASYAAMRVTLGLTPDQIADMLQDSFGVYVTTGANLNNLLPGSRGLYTATADAVGFPAASGLWFVETQRMYSGASTSIRQTATRYSTGATQLEPLIYMRIRANTGEWGPWRLLTVLYGSNNNGSWVRFADGTQICYRAGVTATGFAGTGAVFKSAQIDWVYPSAFSEAPYVDGATNANNAWAAAGTGTTTTGNIAFFLPFSFSGSLTCRMVAQGRWY